MGSSLRFCSDEELQKALTDVQELVVRNPILDEFKSLVDNGDGSTQEMKEKENEEKDRKKKKKKLYRLPPDEVDMLLSFNCEEQLERFPKDERIDKRAEKDDTKIVVDATQVFFRHYLDDIRATQEKMRYELLTKGYVTYEATDDEEDEAPPAAPQGAEEVDRSRRRPGVTKRAGGEVKKLN